MSESLEISDIGRRRQLALWKDGLDRIEAENGRGPIFEVGDLDLNQRVRRALAQDLKECRWSREQVAAAISKLVSREISLAQIDAYCAETKTNRFPVELIPAWVRVTGSKRLLELLCAECSMWLADATEHDLADLARAQIHQERTGQKIVELRRRVEAKV
jgi:hypothetical protein